MMDVILVRHAIALERDASRWPDDSMRPLTEEGESRFRRAVRGLVKVVPAPDLNLASPFVRAWRTAEILNEEGGWPAPKPTDELGAEASGGEQLLNLLATHGGERSVALVGHEPDLSGFATYLLTGSSTGEAVGLKKGAVAMLTLEDLKPGSALLRLLLQPKVMRLMGD
jgi:phosphohistidine phosphatase